MNDDGVGENVNQGGMESEKMLSQSQVDKIVGREKAAAADAARREMQAQQQSQMAASQAQGQSQGQGGQPVDIEAIQRQVYDKIRAEDEKAYAEAQEARQRQAMQAVADKYRDKMAKGPELFDDFKDVMSTFRPDAFPIVTYLASEMENTPEIMYELRKNPQKLADIHTIAREDPELAKEMLERLSQSIQSNSQAKAGHISTQPPLSRLQSSTQVGADKGKPTLRDLKGSRFLRG